MNTFEYMRAASMQDAIKQAASQDAQYIAGGTELLNWMRLRIVEPARLVDIGFASTARPSTRRTSTLRTILDFSRSRPIPVTRDENRKGSTMSMRRSGASVDF